MQVQVQVGDVLQTQADALVSTANPWLNLSGGVNGAILTAAGPLIQEELHRYLAGKGVAAVEAGTVIRSSAGSLPFDFIVHAVAIDPFYDSSIDLVRETMVRALAVAKNAGAERIASPMLATGYGPLTAGDFGEAIAPIACMGEFDSLSLIVVVRDEDTKNAITAKLEAG